MGTSSSQSSPRQGPSATRWAAVLVGYRSAEVPVESVLREIWRAAQSDPAANWRALLKSPGVLSCLEASSGPTPEGAVAAAARDVRRAGEGSVATDVAKRALGQAFATGDPRRGFAEALFSEATNYLVSRDLAGLVGEGFRNRTVSEAVTFKRAIRGQVREQLSVLVAETGVPAQGDVEGWGRLVDSAVDRLMS